MKVGEIYGKNRNKKLLVMYIDFFLMTLFGGIYNIYTSKNYYTSNPQPIGFRGNLLVKRQKFFYCTYSLGITETS